MSNPPTDLFVYGTLMEPRVVERVLGRPFARTAPAVLEGYRRFRVAGQAFPGIAPAAGCSVSGLLAQDLAEHIGALDLFEGPSYERRRVNVVCDQETHSCFAYVLGPPHLFTDAAWDLADFLANGDLERFLGDYPGFGGDG